MEVDEYAELIEEAASFRRRAAKLRALPVESDGQWMATRRGKAAAYEHCAQLLEAALMRLVS